MPVNGFVHSIGTECVVTKENVESVDTLSHRNADTISRQSCARECGCGSYLQRAKRELDVITDESKVKSELNGPLLSCNMISTSVCAVKMLSSKPEPVIAENFKMQSVMNLTPAMLASAQRSDPVLAPVIDCLIKSPEMPAQNELNSFSSKTQGLFFQWEKSRLFNDVLYREFVKANGDVDCYQLVVPDTLKGKLVAYAHAGVTSGHRSANKTYENLRRVAYWLRMRSEIAREISECEQCQQFKHWDSARHVLSQEWPVCRPWQRDQVEKRRKYTSNLVRQNNKTSFARNKRIYDSRVNEGKFAPGDLVWFYKPMRKWQSLTTGPLVVVRRINLSNYVLQRSAKSKPFIANVNCMRPYEGSAVALSLQALIALLRPG